MKPQGKTRAIIESGSSYQLGPVCKGIISFRRQRGLEAKKEQNIPRRKRHLQKLMSFLFWMERGESDDYQCHVDHCLDKIDRWVVDYIMGN
jgi:hypothetical protein